MQWASSAVIAVLVFLLPGFVAASVFHSLTSHPKLSAFDRVIQALIFTLVAQALTSIIALCFLEGTQGWVTEWQLVFSVGIAAVIGLIAAVVSNHDIVHKPLRFLKFTRETSHPSEWSSSFSRENCYVVLHLEGRRRLYGWPEEWPNESSKGHFRIAEAEWLVEGEDGQKRVVAERVSAILIPADQVEMVEFMEDARSEDVEKIEEVEV